MTTKIMLAISNLLGKSEKRRDFAFFEHDNEQFIVIRNSTKYEKIELQLLDKVGYTTKNSQGHGYGLAIIQAIF